METIEKTKKFDCLKMKSEIQAKIYAEIKDMTAEERIAYFHVPLGQDPFRRCGDLKEKADGKDLVYGDASRQPSHI